MEKGFIEELRPTMFQFLCLKEMDIQIRCGKKPNEASIGRKLGVNRSTVNRYIQQCEKNGVLISGGGNFTAQGRKVLNYYRDLEEKLYAYFEGIGVDEASRPASVAAMFNGMDLKTLRTICEKEKKHLSYENIDRRKSQETKEIPYAMLGEHIRQGSFAVEFSIYRQGSNWHTLSMAENGFEHPATLHFHDDQKYLELTVCEMRAHSGLRKDLLMTGHVHTVKCRDTEDMLLNLPIRGGKIRIPLQNFLFQQTAPGEMTARVSLVMTSSVGEAHMPESVATLVVKM